MKYRAILIDPGAHNQEQILTNSLGDAEKWAYGESGGGPEGARGLLSKAISKGASVQVFEIKETLVAEWKKKGEKP